MAVHVISGSLMTSDQTEHLATSVGDGGWVVSYLPGRTLDTQQATAAMQIAEVATDLESWARLLGLTAREAVGMVVTTSAESEMSSRCRSGRSAARRWP